MVRRNSVVVLLAFGLGVAPLGAQEVEGEPDETAAVESETTVEAPVEEEVDEEGVVEEPLAEEGVAGETPAEGTLPTHDWEFVLQPTNYAPEATGMVMVTEGEDGNDFVLEVNSVPLVDDLDQEERDVNAYTVWIAPSKELVKESILAGVLTVGPEGSGSFSGNTELETFGVIVTATPDGAPDQISGVPVLTGIPITEAEPEGAAVDEEPEAPPAEGGAEEAQTEGEAPEPEE